MQIRETELASKSQNAMLPIPEQSAIFITEAIELRSRTFWYIYLIAVKQNQAQPDI